MEFNIKYEEIFPGLYNIIMESKYQLTTTFLRLQEFYESPYENIKGKYFTLEDYMDTYAEDKGDFTYISDYSAFGVPGDTVVDFFYLYSYRLLKKEQKLFKKLIEIIPNFQSGDFFVVGTHKNCKF